MNAGGSETGEKKTCAEQPNVFVWIYDGRCM